MTDPGDVELRNTRRDDPARFLRELRELRSRAGLGLSELAARAHYPCDAIKAAEAGPALPDLPVLSAYVRGCGGTPAEWEERWRSVTGSPASPLLMARGAGWSEAADAGSRISTEPFADDEQDSDRVMAALNRVADGMAAAASASSPPSGHAADVWTPAAPAVTPVPPGPPVPPVPAAPAAPAAPGNMDVWTPAAPGAPAAPAAPPNMDVWTPARQATQATQAAALTGHAMDARTAEPATGPGGIPWPTVPSARPPAAPAGLPLTAAGQRRRPFASRTTLAVCAAITLLLLVILIALFS